MFCLAKPAFKKGTREMNEVFEYYCETDEGVLRFDYELREEWKKEQLIRWKEAFKKGQITNLTHTEKMKLIGTLKWAEDLLREAGHDEAVSDAQDCLMILRKAQEK
jgi:hypothetical protein